MATKKQQELITSFLTGLSEDQKSLFGELILQLSALGYSPCKQRSYIVFKHKQHNKQMAKMGFKRNKAQMPFFELRFSACRGYSKRFEDIVCAHVCSKSFKEAQCMNNRCDYCMGDAFSHVYTCVLPDGEVKHQCGATAIEIPDMKAEDIEELKQLIRKEHTYLIRHEAGVGV